MLYLLKKRRDKLVKIVKGKLVFGRVLYSSRLKGFMKKTAFFAFLALSLLLMGCVQSTGRAVVGIKDPSPDLGTISSIKVTVDSIQVHGATQGWVNIPLSAPKTYDLLQLRANGKQALLTDVQLQEGSYDQIRLHISKVVVTDNGVEYEAKLPSGDLKINGQFNVQTNKTSAATFDFKAGESIHKTGSGKYILTPVVRLETRSNVNVNDQNETDVDEQGGEINTNTTVGMDVNGNVGEGLQIPANAMLEVQDGSHLVITNLGINSSN